jgi:hypothetical protein
MSRVSREYYLLLPLRGEGTLGHRRHRLALAATTLQKELT